MPIYEYHCGSCGNQFETIQKFSDDPLTDCTECGESSLRKLISPVAFRLKGTGWYETDFKNKKRDSRDAEGDGGGAANADEKPSKTTSETGNGSTKESSSDGGTSESSSAKSAPASTDSASAK